MNNLRKEEINKIYNLFEAWNETMIWSCLQGYMGNAWVDNIENPKSAQIIVGDFCFLAGEPNLDLVKNIPSNYKNSCILIVPQNEKWHSLIENVYKDNNDKFMRYATKKDNVFDREKLNSYVNSLSKDYEILKIDSRIYEMIKSETWSEDLCSQFPSFSEYEKTGLGFVIVHNSKIVSGASSYTVYNKGIEIEIDTKQEYRRKGLALACASRLILECIEKGIYPSWDAANKESLSLSEKLGYEFDNEYVTYSISNLM